MRCRIAMSEGREMERAGKPEKGKTAVTGRYVWTVVLAVVFIAALAALGMLIPARPTDALRFGFVTEPRAYAAYGLNITAPDAVISYESYDDLIKSLNGDALDAALLPAEYLKELAGGGYTAIAVVCYMNLVTVENGTTVYSIADLNGRRIVMPSTLMGTPEKRMLDALLSFAGVSADISYADDGTIQRMAQDRDFDVMILPADKYAAVFPRDGEQMSRFDLADQWSLLLGSRPPAGCCLAVRNETMEQRPEDVSDMLSKIRAAVNFLKTSHKKAAVLASANGFGADIDYIRRTIPHYKFEYLDGDAMAEALGQLQSLLDAP